MSPFLCLFGMIQPVPELPLDWSWCSDLFQKGAQGNERVFLSLESWSHYYPSTFSALNYRAGYHVWNFPLRADGKAFPASCEMRHFVLL